uniref:Uncharacterized protein n=1 Tax=Eutreptiella gymnastica TaxID=73025 RepID=A0A7S1IEP8_9EUGL|mmetsp:Transcript_151292/g.264328  ORF Transcript_151292/g.264328 Transcript_151292/m.264328 type:complete len:147 (+) Transcript_151292:129-569(+)
MFAKEAQARSGARTPNGQATGLGTAPNLADACRSVGFVWGLKSAGGRVCTGQKASPLLTPRNPPASRVEMTRGRGLESEVGAGRARSIGPLDAAPPSASATGEKAPAHRDRPSATPAILVGGWVGVQLAGEDAAQPSAPQKGRMTP